MPSPYQRDLFGALNNSDALEATVDYFASLAADRKWGRQALAPYEHVLPGMQFLRGGAAGRFNPGIVRRLPKMRADLFVVSDYSSPTAQIAMRWLHAAGRSWIYWGETPGSTSRGPVGRWVRSQLQSPLRHASAIAAVGSHAASAYKRLFPHIPVFDIPYFCDLAPFRRAAETRAPSPAGRVRILFSGQLIPRKGVDLLVRAFIEALRHAPSLELGILGDGPLRGELERVTAPVSERVVFIGHRDPVDLPGVFAEADVFVLPSRHDGWGVVVNEALGAGLPIVASDAVGAAHDLVADGVNGFVTRAGDVDALRDALVLLANDPARRRGMADASHARAAAWGLDEAVRRWEALCDAVLGRGRAPARSTAEGRVP